MEQSKIYDLLEGNLLHSWREDIEKTESDSWFFVKAQQAFEELEKELNVQQKKLLKAYTLDIENKTDYIYYGLKIKILNLGIKIGMELQKSFLEYENL